MPKRPSARTERASIRPFTPADFEAWRAAHLASRGKPSAFDAPRRAPETLTRRAFARVLRNHEELRRLDRQYNFGVFDRSESTLLGTVSLLVIARISVQIAWIGYRTFDQHRRQGYGAEAVRAVIGVAFEQLLLHRVEAGIQPRNRASIALARSAGMRFSAVSKGGHFTGQKWVDLHVYAINAEALGIHMKPTVRMSLLD